MAHKHEHLIEEEGIVGVYTDEDGDTVVQHDGTRRDTEVRSISPHGKYEEVPGGMVAQLRRTDRRRPVPAGVSHGALDVTAGTTGVLVTMGEDESITNPPVGPLIDTNFHVAVGPNIEDGEPTIQPGSYDGGDKGDDQYGSVFWYNNMWMEPNRSGKLFEKLLNLRRQQNDRPEYYVQKAEASRHDVALVRPDEINSVEKRIVGTDQYPTEIEDAPLGTICMKSGRTTGITEMKKVSEDWTGRVKYSHGPVKFVDQHLYKSTGGPTSRGGDSGSTICWDDFNKVDGRLFAGNSKSEVTIGNPYSHFAETYSISLW